MSKPERNAETASQADRSGVAEDQAWLLGHLLKANRFAVLRDDRVVAYRRDNGMTLGCGERPAAGMASLLALDWFERRAGSRTVELRLSPKGQTMAAELLRAQWPTAHAARQMHLVICAGPDEKPRIRNDAESPLLWLRRRQSNGRSLLGEAEFAAGERLRSDINSAGMLPRVTADWERQPGSGGGGSGLAPSEARIAARQRVDRALSTVGPELSGILMDVCGFLKPIEQIERDRLWPARSAKIVIVLALSALARHYGFANQAVGRSSRTPQIWHDTGHQPSVQP